MRVVFFLKLHFIFHKNNKEKTQSCTKLSFAQLCENFVNLCETTLAKIRNFLTIQEPDLFLLQSYNYEYKTSNVPDLPELLAKVLL